MQMNPSFWIPRDAPRNLNNVDVIRLSKSRFESNLGLNWIGILQGVIMQGLRFHIIHINTHRPDFLHQKLASIWQFQSGHLTGCHRLTVETIEILFGISHDGNMEFPSWLIPNR